MAMMYYTVSLTFLNGILVGILLLTYARNFRDFRAQFNLGLLIFALVFFLQKVVSIYVYLDLMMDLSEIIALAILVLEVLQTVAFTILVWLTLQ